MSSSIFTPFKAALITGTFLLAGCASGPQVLTEATNGGAELQNHQYPRVQGIQTAGEADPQRGSTETWGAFATIPENKMSLQPRGSSGVTLFGAGVANNRVTQQDAEQAALAMCEADGQPGCKVHYVFQGQCFALYTTSNNAANAYGWATDIDFQVASAQAYANCRKNSNSTNCYEFYTWCP